jgi:hypothetical protein
MIKFDIKVKVDKYLRIEGVFSYSSWCIISHSSQKVIGVA